MSEVYLDGEHVEFQGTPPQTAAEAWALIEQHLANADRLALRVELDGAAFDAAKQGQLRAWGRLAIQSESVEDRLRSMAREWWASAGEVLGKIRQLALDVLMSGWVTARDATIAAFGDLQPQIEGMGLLGAYAQRREWAWSGEMAERFDSCGMALEACIAAVEQGDCRLLSDALAADLEPALRAALGVVGTSFLGVQADGLEAADPSAATEASDHCERWASGARLREYSAVALAGVGNGRHIELLMARLPRGCYVFCAEPDAERFVQFAATEAGRRLRDDTRLFFGVGPQADDAFFEELSRFPVLEVQDAATLIFGPLYNERPDFFNEFFLQFARRLDVWRKLFGTNAVASGDWQGNTLANLPRLIGAPDLSAFRGAFAGCEMIVVSAGPSLDESLEALREVGDRAVIVAVNSSFRALRRAGIDPHFTLAADPYEWTDRGFEGVDLGRTILICPFIVFPKVTERFAGRSLTWSQNNLMASYFRARLGLGPGSYVVEQGTVSACAFDVAEIFGCARLTFVGQDLAARETGQSHATDTFYTDLQSNAVDLSDCRWLPGNTLEKVPVEGKLHVYLKTFEQLARERGGRMDLRNTARWGARVEGIPYRPIGDLAADWRKRDEGRVAAVWKAIAARCAPADFAAPLRAAMEALRRYVHDVTSAALRSALLLDTAGEERDPEELIQEATQRRAALEKILESEPACRALLQDGQLKFELLQHRREVRSLAPELSAAAREIATQRSYFWAIAEGGFALNLAIEKALGSAAALG